MARLIRRVILSRKVDPTAALMPTALRLSDRKCSNKPSGEGSGFRVAFHQRVTPFSLRLDKNTSSGPVSPWSIRVTENRPSKVLQINLRHTVVRTALSVNALATVSQEVLELLLLILQSLFGQIELVLVRRKLCSSSTECVKFLNLGCFATLIRQPKLNLPLYPVTVRLQKANHGVSATGPYTYFCDNGSKLPANARQSSIQVSTDLLNSARLGMVSLRLQGRDHHGINNLSRIGNG